MKVRKFGSILTTAAEQRTQKGRLKHTEEEHALGQKGEVIPPRRRLVDRKGKVTPPHRKLDGHRAHREKGGLRDWPPDSPEAAQQVVDH